MQELGNFGLARTSRIDVVDNTVIKNLIYPCVMACREVEDREVQDKMLIERLQICLNCLIAS